MNTPGQQAMQIDCFAAVKDRKWSALWPAETKNDLDRAVDAALGGSVARFSGFCPTAKGIPKWWDVCISPIIGADGKPGRLLVISRDMTAAKYAQDEVEQARRAAEDAAQQLENVLTSTTDCVMTLGRDFRITYLNKRAQEMVGRDLLGMHYDEAFRDVASLPFRKHLDKAFSSQVPVRFEGFFESYDVWLEVYIYPSEGALSIFFKDMTERRRAQEQLSFLAHHDALTGLLNRTVLHERLAQSLAGARPERQTALLLLDLDGFKLINDSLGHTVGDRLLIQVSRRLAGCVRLRDVVARCGGDEFAVLAEVRSVEQATKLAERIIEAIKQPFDLGDHAISVGVSIGIVAVSDAGVAAEDALRDADIALYEAKDAGRASYRIFETAMGEAFQEREALKHDLRSALTRGEFSIHYQPIVSIRTNHVNGFEALLRWKHPTRGFVSPAAFIPVAEECGLIAEIGEWVLRQACRDAAAWPNGITVAVNLSPVQFRCSDLAQTVSRSLSESGLAGERLQLEITESVLLTESAANLEILHALRKLGVEISMDDFGTGYSSLSYLRSFPFDKIKIDRTFVSDLSAEGGGGEANAIARAIIELARGLEITTTAEGVETGSQLTALRAMGCNEVQGFLFSRPVPVHDVPQTISRLNRSREDFAPHFRVVT